MVENSRKIDFLSRADSGWRDLALDRTKRLRGDSRRHARALLTNQPHWDTKTTAEHEALLRAIADHHDARRSALEFLDTTRPATRRSLLTALHPQLAPALADWWDWAIADGSTSDGWRAPHQPDATAAFRRSRFTHLLALLGGRSMTIEEVAANAEFLEVGDLIASAIDCAGADSTVLSITLEIINSEHPISRVNATSIGALLRSNRSETWERVESLLLAAKRQQGLRTTVLNQALTAHPEAFERIVQLTVDHDLLRFAGSLKVAREWVKLPLVASQRDDARRLVATLSSVQRASRANDVGDAANETLVELHMRLLTMARTDRTVARSVATSILRSNDELDRRLVAAHSLRNGAGAQLEALAAELLADEDIRVAALGYSWLAHTDRDFDTVVEFIHRMPPTVSFAPFPLHKHPWKLRRKELIGSLPGLLGDRPITALDPWMNDLAGDARSGILRAVCNRDLAIDGDWQFAVSCLDTPGMQMRVVNALKKNGPTPDDISAMEPLLGEGSQPIRQAVMETISELPNDVARGVVARAWATKNERARDAAAELLATIDPTTEVDDLAERLVSDNPTPIQRQWLERIGHQADEQSGQELLGLANIDDRTAATQPQPRTSPLARADSAATQVIVDLDELLHANRDREIPVVVRGEPVERLIGDASRFAHQLMRADEDHPLFAEVIGPWWSGAKPGFAGGDGFTLDRARVLLGLLPSVTGFSLSDDRLAELKHPSLVSCAIARLDLGQLAPRERLDAYKTTAMAEAALITDEQLASTIELDDVAAERRRDDVRHRGSSRWYSIAVAVALDHLGDLGDDEIRELFWLARWFEQPLPASKPMAIDHEILLRAFDSGIATKADLLFSLMGPNRSVFGELTDPHSEVRKRHQGAAQVADELAELAIEAELARGDRPIPTTQFASAIHSIVGADRVLELLARVDGPIVTAFSQIPLGTWSDHFSPNRSAVLSSLILRSDPVDSDTPEVLRAAMERHEISDVRLIEYAHRHPSWARLVEDAIEWPGLASGLQWLHAHVTARGTVADHSDWTHLTTTDLSDGAVDARWFTSVYEQLGSQRWKVLVGLAGSGARLTLITKSILGEVDPAALVERFSKKRHQDSVRVLGLVPLTGRTADARRDELLERYRALRSFERGSSKFGADRRRNERRAVEIALTNLAMTAGYPDAQRLEWAMESAETDDLSNGPMVATIDDLSVSLWIDSDGVPQLAVRRGERELKAVPAKLRKQASIKAVTNRRQDLKEQSSRIVRSLERAMVTQDAFTVDELRDLSHHPILGPMLENLVLVDRAGRLSRPDSNRFVGPTGRTRKVTGPLRVAHPSHLHASAEWPAWQRTIVGGRRRQPFKQVFRELYVSRPDEAGRHRSERFNGHQVQPSQARALLETSGWVVGRESPPSCRFAEYEITAQAQVFLDDFSHDGNLPSVGSVSFRRWRERSDLALDDVPPVVFSETMRAIDLVVSVAHAGGVDPEATQSTVEMRRALVRETARLFKLDNVSFTENHALITGTLAEYSVHMGSGVAHQRPGAALHLAAMSEQDTGRVFLPFMDDDPATARIVSVVLLLARDHELKDPTVLRQIR